VDVPQVNLPEEVHVAYRELEPARVTVLLNEHGYAYLDGIPEDFDHVAFLRQFGSFMPQYDGELIWSIKAQEHFDDVYHSLNTKPLMPHTECYEFDGLPPKYLALWCVVPAADGGGETMLADMYHFLDLLSDDERAHLAGQVCRFVSSPGLQEMDLGSAARHCMVALRAGRPSVVRFSYPCMSTDDPLLLDIRERVVRFFEENRVAIRFAPRALLIWDNHRMLHSRSGYTDRNRHLRRVWLAEADG
jgi:alpha-ketoglutarate-dependent taurine dioxygenase